MKLTSSHKVLYLPLLIFATLYLPYASYGQTEGRGRRPRPIPIAPTINTNIANTNTANQVSRESTDQATSSKTVKPKEATPKESSKKPPIEAREAPILPEAPAETLPEDAEIKAKYKAALESFYNAIALENESASEVHEYNKWVFQNRKGLFQWQQRSGQIIFYVVISLVITGVIFSGIQFYIAMRRPKRLIKGADAQEGEIFPTTVEASIKGIKISSSVLGVIILFISFMFFYLYLVHVFPITIGSD